MLDTVIGPLVGGGVTLVLALVAGAVGWGSLRSEVRSTRQELSQLADYLHEVNVRGLHERVEHVTSRTKRIEHTQTEHDRRIRQLQIQAGVGNGS